MNCLRCGNAIPEGYSVCPACGAPVNAQPAYQQPAYAQPAYPQQPMYPQQPAANAVPSKPVLTWGILALAFSGVPILGIIFSIIALNKVKAYLAAGGQLVGPAKVGKILATIALPVSIVATVVEIICIIAAIAAGNAVNNAFREVYGFSLY